MSLDIESALFFIPADIVEKATRAREKEQLRKRKYEAKHPEHHGKRRDDTLKPFIMWDGEGPQDAGYALFGNSAGYEICHPYLSTTECLDLLLQCGTECPNSIHVIYGGNYDVSNWLKDLPQRYLRRLKETCTTVWRGYRITYVPRKWFSVSNGQVSIKVFDVVSFFACPFLDALKSFHIGYQNQLETITLGKASRSEFLWQDIKEIRRYWLEELSLGVLLMDTLRKVFHDAGFYPKSWHGPGALARMALDRHHIRDAMHTSPSAVRLASMYAFAGGRFEMPRGGFINERIYNYDKRSAYPSYARNLPNLAKGNWRYTQIYEVGKFGIYHIDYHAKDRKRGRIYPLFRRLDNGEVVWPADVEGWYHQPEAALVANDPDATIIEGWVFDEFDSNDRPFAWIQEYFDKRMVLKNIGNPAEFTFKLIINSIYGQLAQRTGWDKRNRKPPRYHQLEWAGYITSACRAEMFTLASQCGTFLVSIDTDGIYSRIPLPVTDGSALGEWETHEYSRGLFWQSGIYCLDNGTGWTTGKTKTRGIPKGTYTPEDMLRALANQQPLTMKKLIFTGFGLAMNGQWHKLNTWETITIYVEFGGQGKRYHNQFKCQEYCPGDGVHEFIQRPVRPGMSAKHILPWIAEQIPVRLTHDDMVMFNGNSLDDDDVDLLQWIEQQTPAREVDQCHARQAPKPMITSR